MNIFLPLNTDVKERKLMTSGRKLTLISGGVRRKGGKTEIVDPYQANRAHADKIKAITPKNKLDIYKNSISGKIKAGVDRPKADTEIKDQPLVASQEQHQINKKIQDNKQKNKDNRLEFLINQFGKYIPVADLEQIHSFLKDGKVEKYGKWVAQKFKEMNLKGEERDRFLNEDLGGSVVDSLQIYDKHHDTMPDSFKNIDDVKSFNDLWHETSKYEDTKSSKEQIDDIRKNQTEYLYGDDKGEVLIPKTIASSQYYGGVQYKNVNTKWCTAALDNNLFNHYTKEAHPDSQLYIITYKGKNGETRKAQLHLESNQYKDEQDTELNAEDRKYIADNNPEVVRAIAEHRLKTDKDIQDMLTVDPDFFHRESNSDLRDGALAQVKSDYKNMISIYQNDKFDITGFKMHGASNYVTNITNIDKDYFNTHKDDRTELEQPFLLSSDKILKTPTNELKSSNITTLSDNIISLRKMGIDTADITKKAESFLITHIDAYSKVHRHDVLLNRGDGADIIKKMDFGSYSLKSLNNINPNYFKENPEIQKKVVDQFLSNERIGMTDPSRGVNTLIYMSKLIDKNIETPAMQKAFSAMIKASSEGEYKDRNASHKLYDILAKANPKFTRQEMLLNTNTRDKLSNIYNFDTMYDVFKLEDGTLHESSQPILDRMNKDFGRETYTREGVNFIPHEYNTIAHGDIRFTYKDIINRTVDSDKLSPLVSDDTWKSIRNRLSANGAKDVKTVKELKYQMDLKGGVRFGNPEKKLWDGSSDEAELTLNDINTSVKKILEKDYLKKHRDIEFGDSNTTAKQVLPQANIDDSVTIPYTQLKEHTYNIDEQGFASGRSSTGVALPEDKYDYTTLARRIIKKKVLAEYKPTPELQQGILLHVLDTIDKSLYTGILESVVKDTDVEERRVPQGRRIANIRGFITKKGAIYDPMQANRAVNPDKYKLKSRLNSAKVVDTSIKKSNKLYGGAADRVIKPVDYPDSLSIVHSNTNMQKLLTHPDYDAAKNKGDVEAAYRVVESLLKPEVVDNIRKSLKPDVPIYTIPVTKKGSQTGRLNVLPVVYATVLAEKLGGKTWTRVVKKSQKRNTGADADTRATNEQVFVGELPPQNSQSIVVDDCFTSGSSIAGLINKLCSKGNMPVAATALVNSRYQNWLKPTQIKRNILLTKGGITEDAFKQQFGYNTDALTGSEIQQYILTGSRGIDGLRRRFPSRTSTISSGTNPENNKQGEVKTIEPKEIVIDKVKRGYTRLYRGVNPDRNKIDSKDPTHGDWFTNSYERALGYANWDYEGAGELRPDAAILYLDVPEKKAIEYARKGNRTQFKDGDIKNPGTQLELLVDKEFSSKAILYEGNPVEAIKGMRILHQPNIDTSINELTKNPRLSTIRNNVLKKIKELNKKPSKVVDAPKISKSYKEQGYGDYKDLPDEVKPLLDKYLATLPYGNQFKENFNVKYTGTRPYSYHEQIHELTYVPKGGEIVKEPFEAGSEYMIERIKFPKQGSSEPPPENDNYSYRGMHYDEYQASLKRGYVQSDGHYNFETEQGDTLYGKQSSAESYAGGFAPFHLAGTQTKPGVVIAIPRELTPHKDEYSGYRSTKERVPTSEIKQVYFMRPQNAHKGEFDIVVDSSNGKVRDSSASHWGSGYQYQLQPTPSQHDKLKTETPISSTPQRTGETQSQYRVSKFKIVSPDVLKYKGRDIVIVNDGKNNVPFYKSSGVNSGKKDTWFPFEGVYDSSNQKRLGNVPLGYIGKVGTTTKQGLPIDSLSPTFRYGTKQNIVISKWLSSQQLPEAKNATIQDVNKLLLAHNAMIDTVRIKNHINTLPDKLYKELDNLPYDTTKPWEAYDASRTQFLIKHKKETIYGKGM